MNRKLLHRIYLPILCIVLLISASVSSAAPVPTALRNIPQLPAVTQRISFAPGGTSATVSGQVDGTVVDTYLLNARAGQYMQVAVASPGGNVYLTVVSPLGSPLARAQNGAQSFVGTLPENGDYTLQVSAPSGTALTNYTLSVSVTGSAVPPTQQGPVAGPTQRISFAPGGTSAQASGQVGGYVVNYYLVNAQVGQLMQTSVTSPGNNVFMTVAAPSGAILASAPAGAKGYTGTLTESGDYTLRISTIPGGALTNYTVSVSITGSVVQPPPQSGNQRIQFAQGATSATVTGKVSGDVFNGYVIRALAGQRMQLTLMTFALPIYLTLISPGGSPLARAQAGAQSYDGILPETGDYTIQISAPAGTTTSAYALVVYVTNMPSPTSTSERISYATGTSSVQVFDQIDGNSMDIYLLNISANQQLQITVQSPANNVYLTLVSPTGSPLARAQNGAQNYDQIVSETGDYTIQISAPAGTTQTTYTLTATAIGAVVQPPPPPPSGGTQRINFAPGATSAQRSGQVDGNTFVGYVLNARAGQHMQINVASPAGNVYLTLVSPGGSPLARAQAGAQSFDGILPESGDYTVQISAPAGTMLTTFLLTVAIT